MTEYTIEIAEGLADLLEAEVCPEGIDPEQWLSLQVEQTIAEARVQSRQQQLQGAMAALQSQAPDETADIPADLD